MKSRKHMCLKNLLNKKLDTLRQLGENHVMDYVKTNIMLERAALQRIKKRLIDRRISFSKWVREQIDAELATGGALSDESDRPA